MLKFFIVSLLILILLLQYQLWVTDASFQQAQQYQEQLRLLQKKLSAKKQRNEVLEAEVQDLRKGQEAIEEIARYDLGMIKKNETFFQIIE